MTSLNYINYLNLVGFILNVLVTFFASSVFGFPDNEDISEKYQTIITPAGFTFAIWGIIFTSQLLFTIIQFLPPYRSNESIQEGVGLLYFYACMAQSAWAFPFGYEVLWLSSIFMFLILAPLGIIVIRQAQRRVSSSSIGEFWLIQFPFQIHCGWVFVAFFLNISITFISWGASANVQIILASLSLAFVAFVALYFLMFLSDIPNYTIPCVFVWATFGIANELGNPKDLIVQTFTSSQIEFFQILSACLSVILLVGTVSYGIYQSCSKSRGEYTTMA